MVIARALLAVVLLVPLATAQAQHPLILERLRQWNEIAPQPGDQIIAAQVRAAAAKVYTADNGCDVSGLTVESTRPASADRSAFTGVMQGTMRNAWFVTTRVPGCDPAPVRFMVLHNANDTFHTIRVNRGASYAWDSLIGDTLPLASLAAAAALVRQGHQCSPDSSGKLGVLRVASQEPDLGEDVFGVRYSGSWAEIWPIELCGQKVEVQVKFRADGDGGAFSELPGDQVRLVR